MATQDDCNVDLTGLPVYYVNKFSTKTLDDGTVLTVCYLRAGSLLTPLLAIINPLSIAVEDGTSYMEAVMSCVRGMH